MKLSHPSSVEADLLSWLHGRARTAPDLTHMCAELFEVLLEAGVPVARLNLGVFLLHPELAGVAHQITRDHPHVVAVEVTHDSLQSSTYLDSPIKASVDDRQPRRFRLAPGHEQPFPVLTELQNGFEKEFKGGLMPHAKAAVEALFEEHAKEDGAGIKSLKPGSFNRFYAEILFRHFDANNNGTLQLEEAQAALQFLYPTKDGAKPDVNVAFPESAKSESGELRLPKGWFFMMYQGVE